MGELPGRLDLIQRAVKRLGTPHGASGQALKEGDGSHSPFLKAEPPDLQSQSLHAGGAAAANAAILGTLDRGPAPLSEDFSKCARVKYAELRRHGMITPDNLRTNISFEFRTIKRKLIANARGESGNALVNNLVMITSSLPGEGKTFTAVNLALALAAERDIHVVLVDADVIKPSIGNTFEAAGSRGLTDLLNGNCTDLSQVMQRCADVPNLSVIFSGPRDERTPELISSRRTAELLLEMSKRYSDRIVIFDTPPVLASSETASLAEHMHQVIMVVAAGQASHSQVQMALDHVSACRNISLVFNKAPKWHKVQKDSYYYYYGNDRAAE